jgi:hypothetical protein
MFNAFSVGNFNGATYPGQAAGGQPWADVFNRVAVYDKRIAIPWRPREAGIGVSKRRVTDP